MNNFFGSLKFRLILLLLFTFAVFASINLRGKGVFAQNFGDFGTACGKKYTVCRISDQAPGEAYVQFAQISTRTSQQN